MSITTRCHGSQVARRAVFSMLAALVLATALACARGLVVPLGPGKPPKLGKNAERLSQSELREYLSGAARGKDSVRFVPDFANGRANRQPMPVTGGRSVTFAIIPEEGNHLVSTECGFFSGCDFGEEDGMVVAVLVNEGQDPDSIFNLAPGDSAFWFVERERKTGPGEGPMRSVFVRASDPARQPKVQSFEVCHRRGTYRRTGPKADLVLSDFCRQPLTSMRQRGLGQVGSFITPAASEFAESRSGWIPCDDGGCCIGR